MTLAPAPALAPALAGAYGALVWAALCAWAGFYVWGLHVGFTTHADALGRSPDYLTWLTQNRVTWADTRQRCLRKATATAHQTVVWWLVSAVFPLALLLAVPGTGAVVQGCARGHASIRRCLAESWWWVRPPPEPPAQPSARARIDAETLRVLVEEGVELRKEFEARTAHTRG